MIADLPGSDSVKALDEITHWLESLNDTEGFKLDRLFEVVDLLDICREEPSAEARTGLSGDAAATEIPENRLWTCGFKFSKALGEIYLFCVRQQESSPIATSGMRKHMPA